MINDKSVFEQNGEANLRFPCYFEDNLFLKKLHDTAK